MRERRERYMKVTGNKEEVPSFLLHVKGMGSPMDYKSMEQVRLYRAECVITVVSFCCYRKTFCRQCREKRAYFLLLS